MQFIYIDESEKARASYQPMQIFCNDSRTVLQKMFQHNVCNNSDFIVQTGNETYVQYIRKHSDS